jgi:SRSO17 transposase
VSVNAYGYCEGMTFPLKFKIFKPKGRLKEGDKYQTKPELGAEIVKELKEMGFKIKRVLADSLYGESDSNFISVVGELGIEYAVGIRSNHGVWLPKGQKAHRLRRGLLGVKTEQAVRANKWRAFKHISWDRKEETRYIREIIYGKRRTIQYWQITTDKETVRDDSTWFVMTKIPHLKYKEVGEIYKVRAYVEQGFRNSKNELGWADFRLTKYADIQKWWELVMCAYLMVCLHNVTFNSSVASVPDIYQQHSLWDSGSCWKNALNNIQLTLQPFISFNLILRWLKVFPVPQLSLGFPRLITKINEFDCLRYLVYCWDEFYCSSA